MYFLDISLLRTTYTSPTEHFIRFEMKRSQILSLAVLCVFLIGSDGFTLSDGMPGGWSTAKPWSPQVQWAARFAVNTMGPWNSLMYVFHARQQVHYHKNYYSRGKYVLNSYDNQVLNYLSSCPLSKIIEQSYTRDFWFEIVFMKSCVMFRLKIKLTHVNSI